MSPSPQRTIDQLLARRTHQAAVQQITWNRDGWSKVWDDGPSLPCRGALGLIDAEVRGPGEGTIRRTWIRSLADDPLHLLVASTIWGYGNYLLRGRSALAAMLSTPNVESITAEIISASRHAPAEGFLGLFDPRGRSRISHLGIAFGTKVVHFAGYDDADPKPLILDARVYAAASTLSDGGRVPDPRKYTTGAQYQDYCVWGQETAARNGVTAEDVEYALFVDAGRSI